MPLPRGGQRAPDFTLPDLAGKPQKLSIIGKNRPLALFFFCGCAACAAVAREWAALQRTWNANRKEPRGNALTVIVHLGTPPEAKSLLASSGLLPTRTILLPDPTGKISIGLYQSDPCPRLLVLDKKGGVLYVNTGPDEQPQKAAPLLLVTRTADALRKTL